MRFSRLARLGICGLCLSALVAGSFGCSRVRNQFPDRRFARENVPPEPRPDVMAPTVEADAFALGRLDNLPADVQMSALRDHGRGAIVHVEQVPSGAGPMLYRVSSYQDGTPVVTSYRSNGADLNPPEAVIYGGDLTGRPKAKYAPTPEPGVPANGTKSGEVD